jgi:hypothetical protein
VRRLPEAVGRVHGIQPDRLGDSAA